MKRKILITLLAILFSLGLILIIIGNNKSVFTEIDGIKYAIIVDGEQSDTFPIGNYRVDINCTNAIGYWDNINNKIIVKNIKGNVSCGVQFNSITSADYLNTYMISLAGTTQGDGQMVHEIGSVPNYNNTSAVTSYGTTPEFFRNAYASSTTQNSVDSYWNFDSTTGIFTSDPSKMTTSGSSAFYHVFAQVPEEGYYKVCYTLYQSSDTDNELHVYLHYPLSSTVQYTLLTTIQSSTSGFVNGCFDLGYLYDDYYINFSEKGYSGTGSPVMTFKLEKSLSNNSIDTGYRYEGNNPNNFILFNDELWRIIGVFSTEYDSNNDGTLDTTGNLVKIIRNDPIGGYAWSSTGVNDWPNSTLYNLLNKQYYDWDTYKSSVGNYCYANSTIKSTKCDFSISGIHDEYRDMITKSKWYLGGGGKDDYIFYTSDYIYGFERNPDATYTGRSASTSGYIGLLYPSDYLYGNLASDCSRLTEIDDYYNLDCNLKNWFRGAGYEWTISPKSDVNDYVWYIIYSGNVRDDNSYRGYKIRPTVYLSPNIYRVSGIGTLTNPYIIGMIN